MITLGIHDGHSASAALSIDGKIVFAAQEERFTGTKNETGFPRRTVQYILDYYQFSANDLSQVVFGTQFMGFAELKTKKDTVYTVQDWIQEMEEYWMPKFEDRSYDPHYRFNLSKKDSRFVHTGDIYKYPASILDLNTNERMEEFNKIRKSSVARFLGISENKIKFYDHHTCHLFYGYFANSRIKEPTIGVTMDAYGDYRNQTVWKIGNEKFELLADSDENDIGRVYQYVTLILRMKPLEHEYKVMGLAPYAKAKYTDEVVQVLDSLLKIQDIKIVHKNRPKDLYKFLYNCLRNFRFDAIAGGVQAWVEKIVCQLFQNIYAQTKVRNFVLSGGVGMNIKLNKVLSELDFVDDLFVCGSCGDESVSLGAVYRANYLSNIPNMPLENLYLGPEYSDEEIEECIVQENTAQKFRIQKNVKNFKIAQLLASGEVVARCVGRAEFGARALGNRSLLSHPSKLGIVKEINEMIKGRDFWMPFALTILKEDQKNYIKNPKNIEGRYMAMGFETQPESYDSIYAGTHPYDRTVRPQILDKEQNSSYHDLIWEFKKITGIGAILNTSFNLHGYPIANTPKDALYIFENSGLRNLLLGKHLITKNS